MDEIKFAIWLIGVLFVFGIGFLWWDSRKVRRRQRQERRMKLD